MPTCRSVYLSQEAPQLCGWLTLPPSMVTVMFALHYCIVRSLRVRARRPPTKLLVL